MQWLVATLVDKIPETATATTLVFDVGGWPGHLPGQHVDVRLTAEDGYSTQRSYSLSEPSNGDRVTLTVQTVDDGEVSPYLTDVIEIGDRIELRGPIGGWFVWNATDTAPVLLMAGGSGIVPLMAMTRARVHAARKTPFRLIYSVRSEAESIYAAELRSLPGGIDVSFRYTREAPPGFTGRVGRLAPRDVAADGWPAEFNPRCFVCGPTGFVEAAANILVDMGHPPHRIKTERFGPTG